MGVQVSEGVATLACTGSVGGQGAEFRPNPLAAPPEGKAHREKLELVASFSFFGNVMSMASVQLAGAKRDALLLSFKDAKVSGELVGGWRGSAGQRTAGTVRVGVEWTTVLNCPLSPPPPSCQWWSTTQAPTT
jgi:hypothetical protein